MRPFVTLIPGTRKRTPAERSGKDATEQGRHVDEEKHQIELWL